MSIDRRKQAEELFQIAADLAPDDRDAFLLQRCGSDADLLAEVQSLVSAYEAETGGFLNKPAVAGQAGASEVPGNRLGSFKLLRALGEGGMGIVYLAEQDHPRRAVALKLIRPMLASRRGLARFEHEARILGRLQHPGIAQVYEAGTEDTGRGPQPYFAMEYVRGEPITTWADVEGLDTRARLALLAKVCDAVQHAHLRGIVHRDLKPDNILVTSDGQPKVLDFGVARATDVDVQSVTMGTDIGQIVGTLPYMSPEQAGGDVDAIDIRSDVYSLGVIGWELLAGHVPHDVARKLVHEAVRIVRGTDAPRLGTVDRTYRGDIELIVATALDRDATRRYQSAADMGRDIRRYLTDEPISARPPSALYQVRKFAKRHRAVITTIVVMAVSLVGGTIVSTTMAVRESRARLAAETATNDALRANANMLLAIGHAMDWEEQAIPVIDEAMAIYKELGIEDDVDALAAMAIQTFLSEEERSEESIDALREAQELLTRGAEQHGFEAEVLRGVEVSLPGPFAGTYVTLSLGMLLDTCYEREMDALVAVGRYSELLDANERRDKMLLAAGMDDPSEMGWGAKQVGITLAHHGQDELAVEAYARAIAAFDDPGVRAGARESQARALRRLGRLDDAKDTLRRAYDEYVDDFPGPARRVARAIAEICDSQGANEQAEAWRERARAPAAGDDS